MTQEQVGQLFDPPISRAAVALWESNGTRPDQDRLETLARAFKTTIDALITGRDKMRAQQPGAEYGVSRVMFSRARPDDPNTYPGPELQHRVPLISWVQAGDFNSAVDNFHPGDADEWIETTVPVRQHTYALRVRGDSMTNPAGEPTFPDAQVIVVEPDAIDAPDRMVGQFVIVKRAQDDEATFKQLVRDAGTFYLKPLNPRYPMIELREGDVICGVVREKVVRFF